MPATPARASFPTPGGHAPGWTRGRRQMPDPSASTELALSAEDAKLVMLARSARARVGAVEGAAVRDAD
ncbi:MAG TPA: hypothetical protein VHI50_13670, partial [Micromonosporaceae bacterium]|nr:hypothetical protein [Micromonosporaceae bacterium]